MSQPRQYESMEVSELFCPRCRKSQPVRRHLLLVLPTGNQYEFRCAVCATPVGSESDNDSREFSAILTQGMTPDRPV
jgi:endogenous inhibitor of DNA gyrase (YacG/DUF329 family)